MNSSDKCIFSYVKLALNTEDLDQASRALLEALGLECVDQGGAFEAYGIAPSNPNFVKDLKNVAIVKSVAFEAPPAGK